MEIVLTREQVRLYDRLATQRYGIPPVLLMENAGRNAAHILRERYGPKGKAFVCCGTGNNGGDGLVIARHLHNAGWNLRLLVTGDPSRMSAEGHTNFCIVRLMGLDLALAEDFPNGGMDLPRIAADEVVVDGLLGTGFFGEVREPVAGLIHRLNAGARRAMVAVDVPSGLDCDTGIPSKATIRAELTITFVALKKGFRSPGASGYTGDLEVVDIGAPRQLLSEIVHPGS